MMNDTTHIHPASDTWFKVPPCTSVARLAYQHVTNTATLIPPASVAFLEVPSCTSVAQLANILYREHMTNAMKKETYPA